MQNFLPLEIVLLALNALFSGGIFFRLGGHSAKLEHHESRLTKLEGIV